MEWTAFLELVAAPLFIGMCSVIYMLYRKVEETAAAINTELEAVRSQLAAWQLEIVKTYATKAESEKSEAKLFAAIDRIENKLDRALGIRHPSGD